jgi:MerR family copper efflux transcriptional regulator
VNGTELRIGELAQRSGVSIDTIRYYERQGLLPRAPRTAGGYRRYSPSAAARLRFIRHAQEVGFSLDEIGELLALRRRKRAPCDAVRATASERLVAIERKLARLERMRAALVELVATCESGGADGDCPLLEALGPEEADEPSH